MKTLVEQIKNVLTPNDSLSLVREDRIFNLNPIISIPQVKEIAKNLPAKDKKSLEDFLKNPSVIIYNNMVYSTDKGKKFKNRMKELLIVYNDHLKQVIGEKKGLINLYNEIPIDDILNLIENHIIFILKKRVSGDKKGLAAMRYVPSYEVHFQGSTYKMPPVTVMIAIDDNLHLSEPEVIGDNGFYEHPYVFTNNYIYGQKICMGTFGGSSERKEIANLRFANRVNFLIKQAIQILITGHTTTEAPANGRIIDKKYEKYLI